MMASLTDRNLQNAMTCLLDRNPELCAITVGDEKEVNTLEKKIDSDRVEILLRFQPVASDLRQVVSTMKLGSNLERIADQAVKIARRSRKLTMEPELDEAIALGPLCAIFRDSIRAYVDGDTELARSLAARDREIDQMNHDIADDLTAKMADQPDRIPDYLKLLFIAPGSGTGWRPCQEHCRRRGLQH
jgi:phosphate transport system protein